jgi:hypothetical protein
MISTAAKRTAYCYARFATAQQQSGDHLQQQTSAARQACHERGRTQADLSIDNPTQLVELLNDGRLVQGDTIIVDGIDRLSRDPLACQRLVQQLRDRGIRIFSSRDGQMLARTELIGAARRHRQQDPGPARHGVSSLRMASVPSPLDAAAAPSAPCCRRR